jgi:uncharacterized protein YggU (UPF0235/DUF167 family)
MSHPAPVQNVWRTASGVALVRVRLTPKAAHDRVEGIEATADGPALKARVRAVPEKGAANDALVRLIANWLDVPAGAVSLARGGKSRLKTVQIAGDPDRVVRRLEERCAGWHTS